MKRVLRLNADGTEVELGNVAPPFDVIQKIVGGYVEQVRVLETSATKPWAYTYLFANEEGRLRGLPRNERATEIYLRNVRAQFPDSKEPWKDADAAFRAMLPPGTSVLSLDDGAEPPFIAGDVVYFEGWTCDEVDAAMNPEEDDDGEEG